MAGDGGHEVFFYLRHHRRLPASQKDNVSLAVRLEPWMKIRTFVSNCVDTRSGFPRLRRFRWGLIWRLAILLATRPFRPRDLPARVVEPELARVPCDVYLAFGVSADVSRVIVTARATGRPVILFLQSNADIPEDNEQQNLYGESEATARFVLSEASVIVVQSQYQADRLKRFCGRTAEKLRNPIDLAFWRQSCAPTREYVLWVGRADNFHKRPLLCIELARRMPDVPFLMILNKRDPEIEHQVRKLLPSNVELHTYISFTEMPARFGRAAAFLSTSSEKYEGFPNVFLQASATDTPIVSMHDFDGFLSRTGAGVVTGEDLDQMESALRSTLSRRRSESDRRAVADRLSADHDLGMFCRRLDALVLDTVKPRPVSES